MTRPTIEAKAAVVQAAVPAIDITTIIAIITAIFGSLGGLSGICPKPVPPPAAKKQLAKKGKPFIRRHVKDELSPRLFRQHGKELVASIYGEGDAATPEEFAAMYAEAATDEQTS
jgi:hypothetical protein